MPDKQGIQDLFLNKIRKDKKTVTVFLVNGVKLQGVVTWFDNFSILLRRETHAQLVYKHAISTIMPNGPISFKDVIEGDDENIPIED
jgi:host factor-I protein